MNLIVEEVGRERTIPFPKDVRQAIGHYLKLDATRRRNLHFHYYDGKREES
jgi:hypothetical protein